MSDENKLSRREFIKDAAIGAAAVAGAGVLGAAPAQAQTASQPWLPAKWDYEADVVVCGCGATGGPAAIDAYDAGANVLIIEKVDWLGGQMRRCGGGISGAGTALQKKLGIVDDTPDEYYKYLVACGEGLVDEALVRVFADNCGKNVDWLLQDLGGESLVPVQFSTPADKGMSPSVLPGLNISCTPVYFDQFKLKPVQRSHWFKPNPDDLDPENKRKYAQDGVVGVPSRDKGRGGTGLWKPVEDALKKRNIRIMTETSLVELVATWDEEVLGIKALSKGKTVYIKAKRGVVLGAGGFDNNKAMLKTYTLTEWKPGAYGGYHLSTVEETDGSGVLAAQAIGADNSFIGLGYNGGLKINTSAQVINVYGKAIPRLYAGGRDAGGLQGKLYPNGGTYVGTAVCFGRIAGKNAAALKPWDVSV